MGIKPPDEYMVTTVLVVLRRVATPAITLWMATTATWLILALAGTEHATALALVLPPLSLQLALHIHATRATGRGWGAAAMAVGAGTVFVLNAVVGGIRPDLVADGGFPLAGSAMVLVALGPLHGNARIGMRNCGIGLVLALAAELGARAVVGLDARVSIEPIAVAAVLFASLLSIYLRRRDQRRRLRAELVLAERTQAALEARVAEERATALIHDTLLGDLAALAAWDGRLSQEQRHGLRLDSTRIAESITRHGAGRRPSAPVTDAPVEPVDDSVAANGAEHDRGTPSQSRASASGAECREAAEERFRNVVREAQWDGVTVSITGEPGALAEVSAEARDSVLLAMQAALANVRKHAGTDAADVSVSSDGESLLVMVTDAGRGFDPDEVAPDRLGLRTSIEQRLEHTGGSASVWSSPGVGTSVLMRVPTARRSALAAAEQSDGSDAGSIRESGRPHAD